MSKSSTLKRVRNLFAIFLLAYSLVLLTSVVANSQSNSTLNTDKTNPIYQPKIQGITQTIEGRLLTIPDFKSMSSRNFDTYRKSFEPALRQFPELKKATLAKLEDKLLSLSPNPKSLLPNFLAIADNYWSHSEYTDMNVPLKQYVSGTVTCDGRNQPVAPKAGLAISYLELSDYAGSAGKYYGKRWISGNDQQVEGGCGVLKAVNGGKEPTGRLVWGTDTFKIVLNEVDEQTEQASFSAYMRLCANLPLGGKTCTPYFIPLPWFPVSRHNWVVIGGGSL
jgi:hypothetical protein